MKLETFARSAWEPYYHSIAVDRRHRRLQLHGRQARYSMSNVTVVVHPLVQHRLALLRDRTTPAATFRHLLREAGMLLGYEATRDLALDPAEIHTPIAPLTVQQLRREPLVLAPILRAGLALADGLLALVPDASVAHIGVYRDAQSLAAVEYYFKAPARLSDRPCIVLDPMLATGNSAVAALDRLKAAGAVELRLISLLAAPEGLARLNERHPGVRIWTAAVDERLNEHGYIVPGLGDAGDRQFGTG
jgi:uracil phosphoribosyltransferase